MELFFNLGIIGIALMILGKLAIKTNENTQETNDFNILGIFMSYMESVLLAKINLKYGKLLLITGVLGVLFYNTLGLFMVVVMVLVFTLYLSNVFINAYKYYKELY